MTTHDRHDTTVPKWQRFEASFESSTTYANPLRDVALHVRFTSPSGKPHTVQGFWDGGATWRVRFMPDEEGTWRFETACSDANNAGLHGQSGSFECSPPSGATRFQQHGPVRLSDNHRYLVHADGTPFFWLADTCWNGPLRATQEEWDHYLRERVRQGFTAVQWVATQWFVSPEGDREGQLAYHMGNDGGIIVNPSFFQQLDRYLDALNDAGMLSAVVMLWAAIWRDAEVNAINPGVALSEADAIALGRYMIARWGANDVVWILNGDGDYRGDKADRWRHIGRGVFGDAPHAPTILHPNGMNIPFEEFRRESWLDMVGYQSGHGDSDDTLRWIVAGPPATEWKKDPPRPFINLEPPYENHIAYQSKQPHSPHNVRRAMYWSLLVTPTAGVTYGGHGVWGWDDGTAPPREHPGAGIPLPWQRALVMPAAEQMKHLADLFESIEWWELQPAPEIVASQPGKKDVKRYITAARSPDGGLIVAYTPHGGTVDLRLDGASRKLNAQWFDPRTGARMLAMSKIEGDIYRFEAPSMEDWILVVN
jgi:hypothetical protein